MWVIESRRKRCCAVLSALISKRGEQAIDVRERIARFLIDRIPPEAPLSMMLDVCLIFLAHTGPSSFGLAISPSSERKDCRETRGPSVGRRGARSSRAE